MTNLETLKPFLGQFVSVQSQNPAYSAVRGKTYAVISHELETFNNNEQGYQVEYIVPSNCALWRNAITLKDLNEGNVNIHLTLMTVKEKQQLVKALKSNIFHCYFKEDMMERLLLK